MALDACYRLTWELKGEGNPQIPHSSRIKWTCEQFHMQEPEWAHTSDGGGNSISIVRNSTIHEALFFDEPLGFMTFGGRQHQAANQSNIPLQMIALTCRFIVALLGQQDASYVKTAVNTRQRHGLEFT